jgi:hypothetical protein
MSYKNKKLLTAIELNKSKLKDRLGDNIIIGVPIKTLEDDFNSDICKIVNIFKDLSKIDKILESDDILDFLSTIEEEIQRQTDIAVNFILTDSSQLSNLDMDNTLKDMVVI